MRFKLIPVYCSETKKDWIINIEIKCDSYIINYCNSKNWKSFETKKWHFTKTRNRAMQTRDNINHLDITKGILTNFLRC